MTTVTPKVATGAPPSWGDDLVAAWDTTWNSLNGDTGGGPLASRAGNIALGAGKGKDKAGDL
jgi:hypothetical protein